ncbi:uncharacterized protein LOC130641125 [Hydractinia symbiolongicarpus]|uniref:uncharacterized protein LOC130641125 n=1 Tax=Hydractinia symbiolongicarpus TaxID=13093 RepID=UPI00254A0B81|nr:uncharacterized protein LOC130641125 [Hydractinia symbiolongicarpus]
MLISNLGKNNRMGNLLRILLSFCFNDESNKSEENKARKNGKNDSKIKISKDGNGKDDRKVIYWHEIKLNLPSVISQERENPRLRSNTVPPTSTVEQKSRKISCSEKYAYKQLYQELDDDKLPQLLEVPVQLKQMKDKSGEKMSGKEKKMLRRVSLLSR